MIENPVAYRFFDIVAELTKSTKILFVGDTGKLKSLKLLVEAFAEPKKRGLVSGWTIMVIEPIMKGNYYDKNRKLN